MASVRLISHASVVIGTGKVRILTDPWFLGSCFNDSWELLASAAEIDLGGIDYLWISHEHPDHFHIPTLKALPGSFKERVTVLFQQSSDHAKIVAALNRLGFPNVHLLPHRKWVDLGGAEVLCYQSRQIDSALAVRGNGTVLNINDCDFGPRDLAALKSDVRKVDVLLSQFSLAGFDGIEEAAPAVAARILDDMVQAHRALDARVTIPFASFARFACEDNAFLNRFANTPQHVADRFRKEGLDLAVLTPGEAFTGKIHNGPALDWWDRAFSAPRPLHAKGEVALAEIETAFRRRAAKLKEQHGVWLRLLRPVIVDTGRERLRLDLAHGRIGPTAAPADVQIATQPLHFMLSNSFGLQTLGVSGRYRLLRPSRSWILLRILFAMANAGIGLSLKRMFSAAQIKFFWSRRMDLLPQVLHSLARASRGAAA